MNGRLLWQIAVTFASLSLVSVGGVNAVLPGMHRRVVEVLGWMNDATFANLFALSQAAPGPNTLVVALIGWHICGLAGMVVAMLSFMVPTSILAIAVGRLVHRRDSSWLGPTRDGLVPIAIGLTLAGGVVIAKAADRGLLSVAITLGAALFVVATDRNPVWAVATGALVNLLALWSGQPL